MDPRTRQQAIDLYDRFTHDDLPRREFMRRMIAIAGSVAAAEALIGSIAASPAAAAVVPEDDKRLRTATGGGQGFREIEARTHVPRIKAERFEREGNRLGASTGEVVGIAEVVVRDRIFRCEA